MEENDFYVGWMEGAPSDFSKTRTKFFIAVMIIIVVFICLFVPAQQKFSNSVFEYGELTELAGTIVTYPVYGLKTTIDNKPRTVPLVGFGKMGVQFLNDNLISKLNGNPEAFEITLKGTIISYQDKTWMELTEGEESIVSVVPRKNDSISNQKITVLDQKSFTGEIVDPKCFFGVMKPAFGKIHRSCAARCISGGIPPILAVKEQDKYVDYYFIVNSNGKHPGNEILKYVGKIIDISGDAEKIDDWKTLKLKNLESQIQLTQTRVDQNISSCKEKELKGDEQAAFGYN